MIHPVTAMLHHKVATLIKQYKPKSIIDVGGVGKLKSFLSCKVVDANKRNNQDGTKLNFPNDSFDVAVSVATLEHVNDQEKFLDECTRVSRCGTVHWFPYRTYAVMTENFKKRFQKYKHPCVIPTLSRGRMFPFVTVSEHLLLLATLYKEINCQETYDFIDRYGENNYGIILQT